MTGVLGGFTTFSALAVETQGLISAGRPWLAAVYVVTTFIGGALLAAIGRALADPSSSGDVALRVQP
jgi:CrcB protein